MDLLLKNPRPTLPAYGHGQQDGPVVFLADDDYCIPPNLSHYVSIDNVQNNFSATFLILLYLLIKIVEETLRTIHAITLVNYLNL